MGDLAHKSPVSGGIADPSARKIPFLTRPPPFRLTRRLLSSMLDHHQDEIYSPVVIHAAGRIHLTETERKIFDLLKSCAEERGLKVELRVAGGWVRDKLLRLDCKDVDITLDTMMGEAFAGHFCAHMRQHNLEPRGVGVIQSNPDRSKHLETATIHIFGQPIDFVNLRAEEYAAESRIPEKIEFGTPLQDALRRDLTINALFYHIQNDTIEDWSGRALVDLEEGIIRTPLASETTLLDDPLRLLRIIRFASRYGYALVPEIIEASLKPVVHKAFLSKVSRERVGIEFDKTISHANGFQGLRLYARLNAFSLLTMRSDPVDYVRLLTLFEQIVLPNVNADQHRLALLCCPLIPFNSDAKTAQGIVRNALKLSNKDIQEAGRVLKNTALISAYAKEAQGDAVKFGYLLKDIGEHWRLSIWLSCLQQSFGENLNPADFVEQYSSLIRTIEELGLSDAWNFTPLLSGNDVRDLLQLKEGKEVGVKLAKLMEWQYAHPSGSVEEAKAYLLSLQ